MNKRGDIMKLSKLELIGIISGIAIVCAILVYANVVMNEGNSENTKNVNAYVTQKDSESIVSDTSKSSDSTETAVSETELYPYRAMLTYSQQTLYDQIYENAMKMNASFKIGSTLDNSSMTTVMTAVYNDHPEIFWIDTSCSYEYSTNGTVGFVTIKFNDTASKYSICKSQFDSAVDQIIDRTAGLDSDLEKERCVYKALMEGVSYDENAPMNQSAYSAIVNGSSVCAGYARAFQYIMIKMGIPCYLCNGDAQGVAHGWNIVKIDGKFYNVDLTWDDTIDDGNNSFKFFNIPDSVILKDHTRGDLAKSLPICY